MAAPVAELTTLRDWLRWATSRFGAAGIHCGHGTTDPFDEAVYLLLHTLHLPPDRLEPFIDAHVTHAERVELAAVFSRRIDERIPAAYITNEAWLGEYRFYVDPRVLIPRSFIAELLPDGLEPYVGQAAGVKYALDMCTGSGCLAILLAHAFPEADVDAVDISPDALAVAQRNVSDYGLADRVNLICSDLFGNLPEKRYDLIISNPPYVTKVAMDGLPQEYRHEPELGLRGGEDGLDAVRVIMSRAARFLDSDGTLVVEIGHNRAAMEAAFPRLPFVWLATPGSEDSVFLLKREDVAGI
jgi:ribosomal protein L3 glutamine methyltransferase